MRIALVAHTDAPWTPILARAFQARGHQVRVFSFAPDEIPGVERVFLGKRPYDPATQKLQFVKAVPRLAWLLRRWRTDVVMAPYLISNGLSAALAWGGPMIVTACGSDVLQQDGAIRLPPKVRRPLVQLVTRRSHSVHSVADNLTAAMVAQGVPAAKIHTFPFGIELSRFGFVAEAPADLARATDPEAPLRLVCTRKQAPVYQNHVIVDALAQLRDRGTRVDATLLGPGRLLGELRAQVTRLGLDGQVQVLGGVLHAEVVAHLAAADVYVSAASSDGTSASLLEAMAVGPLPVVTRIDANVPWVRHGDNGLLFEVGDAGDLARALQRSVDDGALRAKARRDNRARVEAQCDQRDAMDRLVAQLEAALAR